MNKNIPRQSNIELLRCFAMFCIIVYHIFIFSLDPVHSDTSLYKALQIPFHIGVPLFVMISGYFGIRFSLRGLMRFCSKVYVYLVPLTFIPAVIAHEEGVKDLLKHFFVFGFNDFWYLNCYLYLFLFSPIINRFLANINARQRAYLLAVLSFASIYIGNVTGGDCYLVEGKNLTNFLLLYVVGNTLRCYQDKINALSQSRLIVTYLLFNALLVLGFMFVPLIAGKIWKYGFPYNSPIMLLNCVWVFMIFSKLTVSSRYVNWMGGSIFACYLLQCPSVVWENLFVAPTRAMDACLGTPWLTIPSVIAYSLAAMLVMVSIDKCFSPLWDRLAAIARKYDEKWNIKQFFLS